MFTFTFYVLNLYVCVCIFVLICVCTHELQKRVLNPLQLELQEGLCGWMWVIRLNPDFLPEQRYKLIATKLILHPHKPHYCQSSFNSYNDKLKLIVYLTCVWIIVYILPRILYIIKQTHASVCLCYIKQRYIYFYVIYKARNHSFTIKDIFVTILL